MDRGVSLIRLLGNLGWGQVGLTVMTRQDTAALSLDFFGASEPRGSRNRRRHEGLSALAGNQHGEADADSVQQPPGQGGRRERGRERHARGLADRKAQNGDVAEIESVDRVE